MSAVINSRIQMQSQSGVVDFSLWNRVHSKNAILFGKSFYKKSHLKNIYLTTTNLQKPRPKWMQLTVRSFWMQNNALQAIKCAFFEPFDLVL